MQEFIWNWQGFEKNLNKNVDFNLLACIIEIYRAGVIQW